MPRLILVGAGHAHLAVFRAMAQHKPSNLEVILISPDTVQTYSGMLPNWMMGHYTLADCQIRLQPWIERADLRFIQDKVVGLDATSQRIHLAQHEPLDYDWLSLNTGSETQLGAWITQATPTSPSIVPIRPLNHFIQTWQQLLKHPPRNLSIVGGGAAGVELAFAANDAFQQQQVKTEVQLIAGTQLLAGHSPPVIKVTQDYLQKRGITLHLARVESYTHANLVLNNGKAFASEIVIAATGAQAPAWLRQSGLSLDAAGYVQVNPYQQSLSHPSVFATGDVCTRAAIQRSGVHAVKGGQILAHNLLQITQTSQPKLLAYQPRQRSLYLMVCGQQQAIVSWGQWSTAGHWVWRWKDWIDTRFMQDWNT